MTDMLDAVAKFLLAYAPGQSEEHLYRGYQNRIALPDERDYTVFDISGTQRIGTNIGSFAQAANDKYSTLVLRQYDIACDFCSFDNKTAAQRATTIENLGRTYIAVDFFKEYGINVNYCDDVEYLPLTDLTEQFLHRYRVTMHLTKWEKVTAVQDYAEEVVLQRVENIDGHHKPEE